MSTKAELLSIGTELLLGQIVDTNANYLAGRLALLGIDCLHMQTVGDNLPRAKQALERALSRSDLIVATGGLGPTERSEEHTSELQSPYDLVCRLLLEKKKITHKRTV